MSKIVRSSKYRHVFGTVATKDKCYDEIKVTRSAWDSNYIAVNTSMLAVVAESGGGGAFYVLPFTSSGKVDPKTPLINGHKSPVMDVDWSPFIESLVASSSEDGTAKIWNIPEGGLKETMTDPAQSLVAHKRKVGTVNFHPTANNLLATSSADYSVKVWDIQKGKDVLSVDAQHSDLINSCQWSPNGSLIATACKDKKLRVIDPRNNKVVTEAESHQGIKGSRVVWLNEKRLFTCGFSKTSDREYCLWDTKDLSKPLIRTNLDSASGLLMPFFDADTAMLYLAGKGDGNIRYFEIVDEEPYIHFLSEFKSNTPLRGGCMLPKRAVNVSDCEVARFFKVGVKLVEPISFQVPRKSEVFQDDIFPDCISGDASMEAADWLGGKNAEPKRVTMANGFVVKPKSAEFNPDKQVEDKPLSEKELRDEYEKLKKRVAYLESELIKRDSKIKELGGN